MIGVSGGAAVGGAVGVAAFGTLTFAAPALALVGAATVSVLLAWFIARARPGLEDAAILIGVVANAFASAIVTLIKTLLPAQDMQSLLFWLVGRIDYVAPETLGLVAVCTVVGVTVLVRAAGALELISLSEREAARLGVDAARVKVRAYFAASVLVGAVVPAVGMVGFVGLVVPHGLRLRTGPDLRLLLPAAPLVGASVVVLFDAASRASFLLVDTELPVGALTALVGAPWFAVALARRLAR